MTLQSSEHAGRIVVGVDGSEGACIALRWAMNQARLTGAGDEAIWAWQDPTTFGTAYNWPPPPFDGDDIEAAHRQP